MTNHDVIADFCKRLIDKPEKASSVAATKDKLFSYNTCIAQFDKNGFLYINISKYSVTTTKAQRYLVNIAKKACAVKGIKELNNIKQDAQTLI